MSSICPNREGLNKSSIANKVVEVVRSRQNNLFQLVGLAVRPHSLAIYAPAAATRRSLYLLLAPFIIGMFDFSVQSRSFLKGIFFRFSLSQFNEHHRRDSVTIC